ncbi:hypothetical protein VP01_453g14 [Puccinia sorghi]|uniref:5'-3' exoribonuclease 1 SH3-like domain-containing protein n=1 Tax=Puccinia sorghi TaxID=27349 RepID=A0A0L6UPP6_9BASI|nr:hypothetical protein VP01_453g14 [Puccinia sorghi]
MIWRSIGCPPHLVSNTLCIGPEKRNTNTYLSSPPYLIFMAFLYRFHTDYINFSDNFRIEPGILNVKKKLNNQILKIEIFQHFWGSWAPWYHNIVFHQSKIKGETIVIDIKNIFKGTKVTILTHTFSISILYLIMAKHCKTGPGMRMGLSKNFPRDLDSLVISMLLFMKINQRPQAHGKWCFIERIQKQIFIHKKTILNLLLINFEKSTVDEFPKGNKFFFLEKLIDGTPGQVIGNSNDKLDLHIMLFKDSLIYNVEDFLVEHKSMKVKQAIIKKKLRLQSFKLCSCVTMVRDHRTVCMSAMRVVLGINNKLMEIIFDTPFIGGTSLML